MLTDEGIQHELARPSKAKNAINCDPLREKPVVSVDRHCSEIPSRYMGRLPTISVIEPRASKVQQHTRALTDPGQKRRLGARFTLEAIVGSCTTKSPLRAQDSSSTAMTLLIMIVIRNFDMAGSRRAVAGVSLWSKGRPVPSSSDGALI